LQAGLAVPASQRIGGKGFRSRHPERRFQDIERQSQPIDQSYPDEN